MFGLDPKVGNKRRCLLNQNVWISTPLGMILGKLSKESLHSVMSQEVCGTTDLQVRDPSKIDKLPKNKFSMLQQYRK